MSNVTLRRDTRGKFKGKARAEAFIGLLAICGTLGYAAWYWLTKPAQPLPFVSVTEAEEVAPAPCAKVGPSDWDCTDPELMRKIAKDFERTGTLPWFDEGPAPAPAVRAYMGHLGYDITRYATDPKHEEKVAKILDRMPGMRTAAEAEKYIRTKFPASPVTGHMVYDAGLKYGVPLPLIVAIMEQDSAIGTAGLGAKTRNPGNVMNNDAGNVHYYPSWSQGVEGVARWLSNHKI